MSHGYLLDCQCGQPHVVDPAQAGQTLQCSCGRTLEVPTLRGLRDLKTAPLPEPKPLGSSTRSWSALRGLLFVGGLLLLIGGTLVGGACWFTERQLRIPITQEDDIRHGNEHIDQSSAEDLFGLWESLTSEPLGVPTPPTYVIAERQNAALRLAALVAGGVALAGLVLLLLSLVIFSRSPA